MLGILAAGKYGVHDKWSPGFQSKENWYGEGVAEADLIAKRGEGGGRGVEKRHAMVSYRGDRNIVLT